MLLAVAIGAAALVILSMLGRWRLARLLFPLGLLAVAIAVFIDAPGRARRRGDRDPVRGR